MLKLKIKILTILFFLYMVALGMNASGLPSDEVIPSGVEVILVPHDNNEEEKTEKDKWHRTPIRLPRLLSIDGHTLYGHSNKECLPFEVNIQNADGEVVVQYRFSGSRNECVLLPNTLEGEYTVWASFCGCIYVGVIDIEIENNCEI